MLFPPRIKLVEMSIHELVNSIAGFNREKKEAANIIPADIASIASKTNFLISLKNKIKAEPNVVIEKVKRPDIKACLIGLKAKKLENIHITIIEYVKIK